MHGPDAFGKGAEPVDGSLFQIGTESARPASKSRGKRDTRLAKWTLTLHKRTAPRIVYTVQCVSSLQAKDCDICTWGGGDRIRTCGLTAPNPALEPDRARLPRWKLTTIWANWRLCRTCQDVRPCGLERRTSRSSLSVADSTQSQERQKHRLAWGQAGGYRCRSAGSLTKERSLGRRSLQSTRHQSHAILCDRSAFPCLPDVL
jgi:hypothetical protein